MHYPLLQRALENFNESDLATKPTLDTVKLTVANATALNMLATLFSNRSTYTFT